MPFCMYKFSSPFSMRFSIFSRMTERYASSIGFRNVTLKISYRT